MELASGLMLHKWCQIKEVLEVLISLTSRQKLKEPFL